MHADDTRGGVGRSFSEQGRVIKWLEIALVDRVTGSRVVSVFSVGVFAQVGKGRRGYRGGSGESSSAKRRREGGTADYERTSTF